MSETTTDVPTRLDELRAELKAIAPEVVRGDPDALTELERIEGEIAAEQRRAELVELAAAEQAERAEREAAVALERQRAGLAAEKALLDEQLVDALLGIEETIVILAERIPIAIDLQNDSTALGKQLDRNYHVRPIRNTIADRLARQLRGSGVSDLPPLYGREGMEPLAEPEPKPRATRKK